MANSVSRFESNWELVAIFENLKPEKEHQQTSIIRRQYARKK